MTLEGFLSVHYLESSLSTVVCDMSRLFSTHPGSAADAIKGQTMSDGTTVHYMSASNVSSGELKMILDKDYPNQYSVQVWLHPRRMA
jgi:hypothetical protein